MIRRIIASFVALVAFTACGGGPGGPDPAPATAATLLALINAARTETGAAPFVTDSYIRETAQAQAERNAESGVDTSGSVGSDISNGGYDFEAINLYVATETQDEVLAQLSSAEPGGLLHPAYDTIGIGVASGGDDQHWVLAYFDEIPPLGNLTGLISAIHELRGTTLPPLQQDAILFQIATDQSALNLSLAEDRVTDLDGKSFFEQAQAIDAAAFATVEGTSWSGGFAAGFSAWIVSGAAEEVIRAPDADTFGAWRMTDGTTKRWVVVVGNRN